jgi:sugar phosphate isomerase/epimerase
VSYSKASNGWQVGCCIQSVADLDILEAAGADFCEPPVFRLAALDEPEFTATASRLADSRTPARRANLLLPPELMVVGPDVDQGVIDSYLSLALDRLARLGVTVVVYGSAPSRRVPEGFDHRQSMSQLEQFICHLGELADGYGITIAIEHFSRRLADLLTTLQETAEFVRAHDLPSVKVVADVSHMMSTNEPLDEVAGIADVVAHVHLADSYGRPPGQGTLDLAGFVSGLRRGGYQGDVSIECGWSDFRAEAPAAIDYVRGLVSAPA